MPPKKTPTTPTSYKFFKGIHLAIICIAFLIASLGVGLATWSLIRDDYTATQTVHRDHGIMYPTPYQHVINSAGPVELILLADMSLYVGKVYHVDCINASSNYSIRLQSGVTWDGTNRVAQCGIGFSFKVSSPTSIRIISSLGMTFSP